jgi:hypothetical protein
MKEKRVTMKWAGRNEQREKWEADYLELWIRGQ